MAESVRQKDFYTQETVQHIAQNLKQAVGETQVFLRSEELTPSVELHPDILFAACEALKREGFVFLDSISGVDLMEYNGPELDRSQVPWADYYPVETDENKPRLYMVVYHFFNFASKQGIICKTVLTEKKLRLASIDSLFGHANWLEREVFDLFGVVFESSRDLRRIMLPEDWVGFPLRKDYQEQESYHGMSTARPDPIEVLKKYREQKHAGELLS